jgi:hypothetical protein
MAGKSFALVVRFAMIERFASAVVKRKDTADRELIRFSISAEASEVDVAALARCRGKQLHLTMTTPQGDIDDLRNADVGRSQVTRGRGRTRKAKESAGGETLGLATETPA